MAHTPSRVSGAADNLHTEQAWHQLRAQTGSPPRGMNFFLVKKKNLSGKILRRCWMLAQEQALGCGPGQAQRAPAWPNTSSSGQVFWRCWKISSGSTAACVASCAASARPRAHSGTGLRGAASLASSSSLSWSLLRQQDMAFAMNKKEKMF